MPHFHLYLENTKGVGGEVVHFPESNENKSKWTENIAEKTYTPWNKTMKSTIGYKND